MTGTPGTAGAVSPRRVVAPVRAFLRTESGSSGVLLAAIVVALVWADVGHSYETVWHTRFAVRLGAYEVSRDLRDWVGSGLMALFFLVVGLEARRESDLGDLRDRVRVTLPMAAGLAGMALPVVVYLAVNLGTPAAHGWGVAMSTDTALALGLLALLGRDVPDRVRVFLLTLFIVDDLVALLVIAVAYSEGIRVWPLVVALVLFAGMLALRTWRRPLAVHAAAGLAVWAALLTSGVDPVVAGLAVGLATPAYVPGRAELETASGQFREFREQPTAALARSASSTLQGALSPNVRLQQRLLPVTSYLIVPVFGLANAGIPLSGSFLAHAFASRITLGILAGYVLGKPVAVIATSALVTRVSKGRLRPPVGWAAVTGSGTIAGVGFTVAVLIATLAFTGTDLAEAKVGILASALLASALTFAVYRVTALLPEPRRSRALLGAVDELLDLTDPVDPARDHVRGPADAVVTVVEYGDFECPYCGQAEPAVRAVLAADDVRFVWRHLPLPDVHPRAELAAEAAEAAARQGAFWPMHDLLLARQDALTPRDLLTYAGELGLDVDRFRADLMGHTEAGRVAEDVQSADLSAATGTPTFFVDGRRHYGAYDAPALAAAVAEARTRALLARAGATVS